MRTQTASEDQPLGLIPNTDNTDYSGTIMQNCM